MTTQDEQIIAAAKARHDAEHGRQAFNTCQDDGCRAAQWVMASARCYPEGYGISPLVTVAPVVFEINRIFTWFERKHEEQKVEVE